MDKLVANIAALGVPGLVLLVVMAFTGYAGAAALTTALAALGGPFGMLGGIGVLGLLVLMSKGISKYGFEKIYEGVISELLKKGETKQTIVKKIGSYPISNDMKLKLKELLSKETDIELKSTITVNLDPDLVGLIGLAKAKDIEAQNQVADRYFKGIGVSKNFVNAFEWSKLAAENGNIESQIRLSILYEKGWGTKRDTVLSAYWKRQAKQ